MSRFAIVLDPEDYNERLTQATRHHAMRAAWLLIALAALVLLGFGFSADDGDTGACRQRLIAPGSRELGPNSRDERIDRLDWDSEGYERGVTARPRTITPPCPS